MTLMQLLKTTKGQNAHLLELALEWGFTWGEAIDALDTLEGVSNEWARVKQSVRINQVVMV